MAVPLVPTLVQSRGSRAALTVPSFIPVTKGNVIVACLAFEGGSGASLSDTIGTSYTVVGASVSGGMTVVAWFGTAPSSGANTITFTGTGLTIPNCAFAEFANTIAFIDGSPFTGGFAGTPSSVTTGAITTSVGQSLLFAYIGGFRNAGRFMAVSGSGYSMTFETTAFDSTGGEFAVAGVNGSYTANFTNSGNDQGAYIFFALKAASALTVATQSVPNAALNVACTYTLQAVGGVGAYTWVTTGGTLPTGVTLSSAGVLSGTPTVAGVNPVTFKVTDSLGSTATRAVTVGVGASFSTPTHIQAKGAGNEGSSVNTLSFDAPNTCGSMLLVAAFSSLANVFPITDTLGTPYQLLQTRSDNAAGSSVSSYVSLWAGVAPSNGANTVTSNGGAVAMIVSEFSGLQIFSDNGNMTNGSTVSGTITSSSLTTLVVNELLYTVMAGFSNTTVLSISAPFTQEAAVGGIGPFAEDVSGYQAVTTISGYTSSASIATNAGGLWTIFLQGFRPEVVLTSCQPTLLPPPPTCSLAIAPTTMFSGSSATLSWITNNNPTTASIDNGIGAVNPAGGSVAVSPTASTTYHLTVTNAGGNSICQASITVQVQSTCTVTVTVNAAPPPPISPTIPPNTPCARKLDCEIQLYKHPLDIANFTFDWSGWMALGDTIASSFWAADTGLAVGVSSNSNTVASVQLSGGTDTFAYMLRNLITTAEGRTEVRTAAVNIFAGTIPDPPRTAPNECLLTITKNPAAIELVLVNWTSWLEPGDSIANFSFTAPSGLLFVGVNTDGVGEVQGVVSGGVAGQSYLVEHKISTQLGLTDVRHILVIVETC